MSQKWVRIFSFLVIISVSYEVRSQQQLPVFDEMVILAPLPLSHEIYSIKRNSSVHEALMAAKVDSRLIHQIVKTSKPVFDLRHVQPGTRFVISKEANGDIRRLSFDISPLQRLEINYTHKEWSSEIVDVDTTKQLVHFGGVIQDSLWSSAIEEGLSPEVIVGFAEVFGWQVDFSREVRKGDVWKFSVEKLFAEGRAVGWGNIVYAEYKNGPELYKAYYYQNKATGTRGYFEENGESLRKVFLKSPIKFGRITSHFSKRRFHPIHRRYKAHNGVDYGAPRGTPIRAVGDGRIMKIGRFGGSGKMIVLDHVAGYRTKYLHMSRFKSGLRRGSKVLQGDIIGYVGSTGYATGPHLHFEMSKHRKLMDPQKVSLPAANPVPEKALAHFKEHVGKIDRGIASLYIKESEQKSEVACCEKPELKTINSKMQ